MVALLRNVILVLAASMLAACERPETPPLVASDVEITRPMPGMSMSAGYMHLENNSGELIRITRVSSPNFGAVEIHETTVEDDIARMRRVDKLEIAPGGDVRLQRGGKHLMLIDPTGSSSEVTLNLYSDERLVLAIQATLAK